MINRGKFLPTEKTSFFYGWYMVAILWIMIFLTGSVAVSIFFKPMLEDFGWDRATLSSVQSVALLIFTIASPLIGRLIDRFGPKTMLLACVVPQVLSRMINGMATSIWQLYIARIFYGVNVLPSAQVLISRWFVSKRGIALGIFSTGMPLGTMILAPISQYMILTWGWRMTMFFWAAVTFVVMLPLALGIKNDPRDKGYGPDGEPLLSHGTNDRLAEKGDNTLNVQVRGRDVKGFSEVIENASFWFLSFSHFICGIGCGIMMTHIVIFTIDMGYSDMVGASLVSVQGGLNLVGLLFTGPLSDRIPRKKVLALIHFIRFLSFVIIVIFILLAGVPLWLLYAAMALFGFGWFTTAPLTAGLVADLFGSSRMGTISGVVMAFHMFGMAAGAYVCGVIFDFTNSYFVTFLIQGPLELLAAIFALFIKRKTIKQNIIKDHDKKGVGL
ncbi:MFS transporter [Thermodesulfobacteriota bacterium]